MENATRDQLFTAALAWCADRVGRGFQTKLSKLTGIASPQINDMVKGRKGLSEDKKRVVVEMLYDIDEELDFAYDHIFTLGRLVIDGQDPEEYRPCFDYIDGFTGPWESKDEKLVINYDGSTATRTDIEFKPDNQDFTLIPKYNARLSGGAGSLEDSDQIEANYAFRTEWIKKKGSNNLALFEVVGDSMAPFICECDVVMVDMNQSFPDRIVDGKTYAIQENSSVKIKRLVWQGGQLLIRSQDRENYPDYEAGEDFFLIGKVIWVGHEVK